MKLEFLNKAKENLTVAQSSYEQGHYNASANRAYYAAFQAAIAALAAIGKLAEGRKNHESIPANFVTELIHRCKICPSHLKSYLVDLQRVREEAD